MTAYQLEILDSLLAWPYVIDSASIKASLEKPSDFASGQILSGETLDKIDLFLLEDNLYSQEQMRNRRRIEVVPGTFLPFTSPEDILIMKLRWFVLGNRVSDRQWNDIVQVLEIQGEDLDRDYSRK